MLVYSTPNEEYSKLLLCTGVQLTAVYDSMLIRCAAVLHHC